MTRIQSAAIALAIAAAPLTHAEEPKDAVRVADASSAVPQPAAKPAAEEVVQLRTTVDELKKEVSALETKLSHSLVYVEEGQVVEP